MAPIELAAKYYNKYLFDQYSSSLDTVTQNIVNEKATLYNICHILVAVSGCFYALNLISGRTALIVGGSFFLCRLVVVESFKGALPSESAEGHVVTRAVKTVAKVVTNTAKSSFLSATPKIWIHVDTFVVLYEMPLLKDLLASLGR